MFTFEGRIIWLRFQHVVGGCSQMWFWWGWVDLNTNALISGFTIWDDSTNFMNTGGKGCVAAACSSPHLWFRHVKVFSLDKWSKKRLTSICLTPVSPSHLLKRCLLKNYIKYWSDLRTKCCANIQMVHTLTDAVVHVSTCRTVPAYMNIRIDK